MNGAEILEKENISFEKREHLKKILTGERVKITKVESPWFIKFYKNKPIVTIKDFNELTGLGIGSFNELEELENGLGKGWDMLIEEKEIKAINETNNTEYKNVIMYLDLESFLNALDSLKESEQIGVETYESINRSIFIERSIRIKII